VASLVILLAAFACDAYSMWRKTWCPLTLRRQTPKNVLYQYGAGRAAIAWGLDAGLVFTTYRMSSICWALLALEFLGAAPWWIGLGYGAGFVIPLLFGCSVSLFWNSENATTVVAQTLARRPAIARIICVAGLTAAVISYRAWLA